MRREDICEGQEVVYRPLVQRNVYQARVVRLVHTMSGWRARIAIRGKDGTREKVVPLCHIYREGWRP